jgi:MFS family permease
MTITAPSPFALFRNRSFTLMWSGQLVSTIGSALTSLAASILVYRLTDSALSVGLMLMATAAPSLLIGLIAGVFVDRYDRKKIMIAADVIRGVLVVLIPFLLPSGIAWLYIIVMLSSAVGQFYDPAHDSMLPEIATDEELAAANSLMAISSFGATAVGFAASGLIASQFSIEWAFYIDAATFVVSAVCILLLRVAHFEATEKTSVEMVKRNLKIGARFLLDTPILRSMFFIYAFIFVLFGLQNALLLPFSLNALHSTEFQYSLVEGMQAVGFVVGSFLMARLADRLQQGQWIVLSFVGMGLFSTLFSIGQTLPIALVMMTLVGWINAPSVIARQLVIQRNTPRELRGRVNSAFFVVRSVCFMAGMAMAGLADLFDVRAMFLISSIVLVVVGLLAVVLPGLGQPAAEWRRALSLLRAASTAPGLGMGRAATLADFDALVGRLPILSVLDDKDRRALIAHAIVNEAPAGTTIVRYGDKSDAAFFLLSGRAVAGLALDDGRYRGLSTMQAGDFFGEIAALTGSTRTANVVAEDASTLMQIPAKTLHDLMSKPVLSQLFLTKMTERLGRTHITELPRFAGADQDSLRELRTATE